MGELTVFSDHVSPGIFIMQNTMVRGRGSRIASWGKKLKLGVREIKWKRGKKKGGKLY